MPLGDDIQKSTLLNWHVETLAGLNRIMVLHRSVFADQFGAWLEAQSSWVKDVVRLFPVAGGQLVQHVGLLTEALEGRDRPIISSVDLLLKELDLAKIIVKTETLPSNVPFLHLIVGRHEQATVLPYNASLWVTNRLALEIAKGVDPGSYKSFFWRAGKLILNAGRLRFSFGSPYLNVNTPADVDLARKIIPAWQGQKE